VHPKLKLGALREGRSLIFGGFEKLFGFSALQRLSSEEVLIVAPAWTKVRRTSMDDKSAPVRIW